MPTCPVHIKPDRQAFEPPIKMSEHPEKSCPISSFCLHDPMSAQQWRYPAREVQPLLMLACCWNTKSFANAGPAPSQARMQRKAGLILENKGLVRPQGLEFFLRIFQTSWHLPPSLEDKHGRPASTGSPIDASSSGPVALSVLFQTAAVNDSPGWGHPIALDLIHTPEATLPTASLTAWRAWPSIGQVARAGVSPLALQFLSRLRPESIDSGSCGLIQGRRQSNSASAPPLPARVRRSSDRSMRQGWSWPNKSDALLSLPDDRGLSLS